MQNVKNDIIDFYEEKGISPVKQDIDDFSLHLERRRKLYRQCGIPVNFFRGAKVMEVGPGGGYNTLAFFEWGADVDLVEPNSNGVRDIIVNFDKHGIPKDRYNIVPKRVEQIEIEKKYDIVIAEGFLDAIDNQGEVINKLKQFVKIGGVVVITCADNACFFIETIKRLIGVYLTKDITEYEKKVDFLVDFFAPQLENLRGMSRTVRDWVEDQMMCPSFINGNSLSMADAVDMFDGFYLLGSSQKMFTDYSWYKDVWYDEEKNIKDQFGEKRLSLLMANMPELILDTYDVNILVEKFTTIRELASKYENSLDIKNIKRIRGILEEINNMIELFPIEFRNVFGDVCAVIEQLIQNNSFDLANYRRLFAAFGRTQQYMAFEKK